MGKPKRSKKKTPKAPHANGAASSAPAPKGAVQRGRHKEKLPCRVDGDLVEQAGKELARCERDRDELKDERRTVMAGFRERLSGIDERAKESATTIEMGTVARDVWVTLYLLPTNEIQIVREDTGEVVATRPATPEELQGSLVSPGVEDLEKLGVHVSKDLDQVDEQTEDDFEDELDEQDAPGP